MEEFNIVEEFNKRLLNRFKEVFQKFVGEPIESIEIDYELKIIEVYFNGYKILIYWYKAPKISIDGELNIIDFNNYYDKVNGDYVRNNKPFIFLEKDSIETMMIKTIINIENKTIKMIKL